MYASKASERFSVTHAGSVRDSRKASKPIVLNEEGKVAVDMVWVDFEWDNKPGVTMGSPGVLATLELNTSSDRSFHLQLDQTVHLDGVLHGQLLDERLNEPGHDHRARFGFGQAAAHQIEQLIFRNL